MRAESENNYRYIVIEGNIGAGKTSLARMIADTFGARLILERFANNPFLPKFYKEPDRYSFPLELSFLADRYMQMKEEAESPEAFIPFTIADFYIMKSMVFASATLQKDELRMYSSLFNNIVRSLPEPDLYIYLHVDTGRLIKNIASRGREYEATIDEKYLLKLQNEYFSCFSQNPQHTYLILDINNIDFVNVSEDYLKILEVIFKKRHDKGINRAILR